MTENDRNRYKIRADIAKALAHPTRLFILDYLKDGEKCVCEITEQTKADISTVSKHLSLLKKEGLIQDRKQGNNVYYSLRCLCLDGFFNCLESVLKDRSDQSRLYC